MPGRRPILLFAFAAIALASLTAEELSIRVYDRDLDIPLEGVSVQETTTGAAGITGIDGTLLLNVDLPAPRAILSLTLIGYEPVRTMVTDLSREIVVPMVIEGVLEAEELVVEARKIGRTDDEVGESVVVEREMIKQSAMIGIVEDVMSTVKILPGVSYAGNFNTFLSVRGGEPGGLTHVLDGFVIKYPYHWGGGVSVFNPHVIDTVKLSAGIFPVKYGQATSGLMEVTTVNPTQGLRWEFSQSTSTLEGYVQVPFGAQSGLFVGTRLTNYDLVFALTGQFLEDQGVTFSRIPFIYDGYLRWYSRPTPGTEWFVNGFAGTDGIGLAAIDPDVDESSEILNTFDFAWINYDAWGSVGVQQLLGDRLLLHAVGGYEFVKNTVDAEFTERGTRSYSEEFVEEVQTNEEFAVYRPFVTAGGDYSIDLPNGFYNSNILHHTQGRLDLDYQIEDDILQTGGGAFLAINEYDARASFWVTDEDDESGQFTNRLLTIDQGVPSNRAITSFAYANYEWNPRPGELTADLGLRGDHWILYSRNGSLNTVPALGPRALVRYTREPHQRWIEEMSFSGGSGIFTAVPFDASLIDEDWELGDFSVQAPKSFMTLAGWEARFVEGVRFKIEAYYKYLYDRYYINFVEVENDTEEIEVVPRLRTDGIGHAGGFDLLLDRRTSRWVDGMLSYSFIYARYKNPTSDDTDENPSEPRERWYYPSFHRFHTLNALINLKPRDWLTVTTTITFASGDLSPSYGEKEIVPTFVVDNREGVDLNVMETYEREQFYNDDNRNGWVLPVDIRASIHNYRDGSKVYREFYVGVEDVLAPLINRISPDSDTVETDKYTGEDTRGADQDASFPIISVGFRLSY